MANPVFRKAALERLASPDQLDQLLQVTRPRGWIALSGFGLLLGAALTWGIFGSIDNRVQAQGILLRSGGVLEIAAPAAGRVVNLDVQVGDSVHEGQVIGSIAQPEIHDQIAQAKDQVAAASLAYAQALQFAAGDEALLNRHLEEQRTNLAASIQATQGQSKSLSQRLDAEQQLLAQGLIAAPSVLATRQQHEQVEERIRSLREDMQRLEIDRLEAQNRRTASIRDARFKKEAAEADLARSTLRLEMSTKVVSTYRGRVLEIITEPGRVIARGEPLLTLDRAGGETQDLVAVIYVPALLGKRVRQGMSVQIAPTTVRQEEYGMLMGTVKFVSSFPATNKGMQRVLKNDQLIQQLTGGAAPYEVHATLSVDPTTISRYRWTSANGPPMRMESGTLAGATIIVGHQMPLSMVVPILGRSKTSS